LCERALPWVLVYRSRSLIGVAKMHRQLRVATADDGFLVWTCSAAQKRGPATINPDPELRVEKGADRGALH
jgi:hypothetical protein